MDSSEEEYSPPSAGVYYQDLAYNYNNYVDAYPEQYHPVQYHPEQYHPVQYDPEQYHPVQYDQLQYQQHQCYHQHDQQQYYQHQYDQQSNQQPYQHDGCNQYYTPQQQSSYPIDTEARVTEDNEDTALPQDDAKVVEGDIDVKVMEDNAKSAGVDVMDAMGVETTVKAEAKSSDNSNLGNIFDMEELSQDNAKAPPLNSESFDTKAVAAAGEAAKDSVAKKDIKTMETVKAPSQDNAKAAGVDAMDVETTVKAEDGEAKSSDNSNLSNTVDDEALDKMAATPSTTSSTFVVPKEGDIDAKMEEVTAHQPQIPSPYVSETTGVVVPSEMMVACPALILGVDARELAQQMVDTARKKVEEAEEAQVAEAIAESLACVEDDTRVADAIKLSTVEAQSLVSTEVTEEAQVAEAIAESLACVEDSEPRVDNDPPLVAKHNEKKEMLNIGMPDVSSNNNDSLTNSVVFYTTVLGSIGNGGRGGIGRINRRMKMFCRVSALLLLSACATVVTGEVIGEPSTTTSVTTTQEATTTTKATEPVITTTTQAVPTTSSPGEVTTHEKVELSAVENRRLLIVALFGIGGLILVGYGLHFCITTLIKAKTKAAKCEICQHCKTTEIQKKIMVHDFKASTVRAIVKEVKELHGIELTELQVYSTHYIVGIAVTHNSMVKVK